MQIKNKGNGRKSDCFPRFFKPFYSLKKNLKKFQKGVDKRKNMWYYIFVIADIFIFL